MTKIPWTEATWSPVVGCTKCSPGCLNCYAERMAFRLSYMGNDNYFKVINDSGWNGKIECLESALDKPLHWRTPKEIFVCSMSDLFHPKVPFEFIHKIWDVMKGCPQHKFQVLTKRPERMLKDVGMIYKLERFGWAKGFWEHIHLGVSVCNQAEADENIPILLQIPAAVRFISIEPMLEEIDIRKYLGLITLVKTKHGYKQSYLEEDRLPYPYITSPIQWVIVGAESINGRPGRECKIEWVDSIVAQCAAANIPCFIKQVHRDGKLVKMPQGYAQEKPQ